MHQSRLKRRKSVLPSDTPVVNGLEPTQEEVALQKLELSTENATETDHLSPEITLYTKELVNANVYNTHHIHPDDDIDICSNFLVGPCFQGLLCPKHHTAWPYVWQLRYRSSGVWLSIDEGAQLLLERLYSDPAMVHAVGFHQCSKIAIDLSTLTVLDSPTFDRVRRLSTSTCPTAEFHTVYRYYYEEEGNWLEYNSEFVQFIEEGLRERHEEVLCSTPNFSYSLHLVNMIQTNLDTESKRRMRKRPLLRSPIVNSERLRALWVSLHPPEPLECSKSQPGKNSDYPNSWRISNPELIYEKSQVTCADSEYTYIYTYFHKTMAESKFLILEVLRIQNYFQWKKYSQKKTFMQTKLKDHKDGCLERYLFHGTPPNQLEAIFSQNFDPRVSGKNGRVYGRGTYFARDASYSHGYAHSNRDGHHFMFLAKVLVGHTTVGCYSYTRPPPLKASSLLYDSCVNTSNNPAIFVIFDSDQFYPYFIIKYQKLHGGFVLD
ncbi:protein mono-ADP-ribosyltransferase TIPARP-like [Mantella aurantiaca]